MWDVALAVIIERIVENIKMEKEQIVVSVLCLAYNHEKYIRQCLDGFIMQKANFAFEVLVNDDASTDGTAKIIREYEEKYPDIIKPTYQTENQHSQGVKINQTILFPKAKGKYIAFCEGDDYWVDPYKLQKQVDVLENNPDCHFCVHRVESVDEDGSVLIGHNYPSLLISINEGIITSHRFIDMTHGYNFQTSSYMENAQALRYYYVSNPKFKQVADVGDEPMLLYFGNEGNVFFVDRIMSKYRRNVPNSMSSRFSTRNRQREIVHCIALIKMLKEFDKYSNYVYHDVCKKRIRGMKRKLFHARMHVLFPNMYPKFYNWCKKVLKGEKT
jgi:glycosyltransferase involved in cell wall biosynthesis